MGATRGSRFLTVTYGGQQVWTASVTRSYEIIIINLWGSATESIDFAANFSAIENQLSIFFFIHGLSIYSQYKSQRHRLTELLQ